MRRWIACWMALGSAAVSVAGLFSDAERLKILQFWNEPDRYTVTAPPDAVTKGPWCVRLSVAASQWLWNYDRARGLAKGPPTQNAAPANPDQKEWDAWIDTKLTWDRWNASRAAFEANNRVLGRTTVFDGPIPAVPGPAPLGLIALAGNPPGFADVVAPLFHSVRFDEKMTIGYPDNPLLRPRYAYYRFPQGVMSSGSRVRELPPEFVDGLFTEAGVSASEKKVMAAVSLLEGGFDSVNTYDTGFVSVGFIQFACLKDGAGSLGAVLRRQKQEDPESFQADFRDFGVDVAENAALTVLDPATGAELTGAAAAMKIIDDKRLIAVFQRAGKLSKAFRMAQIRVAKAMYYPSETPVTFQAGGKTVAGPISAFIKSEAGMATLMDRKVNTGNIEPLPIVVALIAAENGVQKIEDLARFERDIVAAMKFRKDYLADATLTQPGPARKPQRDYGALARHQQGRRGRGGKP